MDIQSNLKEVQAQLPPQVILVAVSKFHPNEAILAAYETGQRIFGESKEQELSKKQASLPADIQWHFIGHLQSGQMQPGDTLPAGNPYRRRRKQVRIFF